MGSRRWGPRGGDWLRGAGRSVMEAVGLFGMETGREGQESFGMEAAFLPVLQIAS